MINIVDDNDCSLPCGVLGADVWFIELPGVWGVCGVCGVCGVFGPPWLLLPTAADDDGVAGVCGPWLPGFIIEPPLLLLETDATDDDEVDGGVFNELKLLLILFALLLFGRVGIPLLIVLSEVVVDDPKDPNTGGPIFCSTWLIDFSIAVNGLIVDIAISLDTSCINGANSDADDWNSKLDIDDDCVNDELLPLFNWTLLLLLTLDPFKIATFKWQNITI